LLSLASSTEAEEGKGIPRLTQGRRQTKTSNRPNGASHLGLRTVYFYILKNFIFILFFLKLIFLNHFVVFISKIIF